ncbi:MAG: flagellar export chaperone FliS [Candidatus Gastranaerophilales bacterium]|nr:flagellar export chaperone FliS [Candidatus Gastranaerophilales bacterium]
MTNPYLKQYQQSQIQTAPPEQILIMLYDGAIQFLNKALVALEQKNIQESHNNIIGAQNIIMEFMNTLNMDIGGEVARNLYSLYEYPHYRLIQANINRNAEMVQEVLRHLKDLKATWEEAIRIAAREKMQAGQSYSSEEDAETNADSEDEEEEEEEEEESEKDFVG